MPINLYKNPEPLPELEHHLVTPSEKYDLNFCYPDIPDRLETPGGVVLVPIIPSLHARPLFEAHLPHPSQYQYFPYGPFDTLPSFLTHLESFRSNPQNLAFAIFDQSLQLPPLPPSESHPLSHTEELERDSTRPERLAGRLSFTKADNLNRTTELGGVFIFPSFQRRHILTHSTFLILQFAFESLKLRRVQWYADAGNIPSQVAARRLGFREEGVVRWDRVQPSGKGIVGSEGDAGTFGRHVVPFSTCWDDWRDLGMKEALEKLVAREVRAR
ncbi:acyl-CoA N-acyltransferase [Meredithblackwellia eburnea MCA 4105]